MVGRSKTPTKAHRRRFRALQDYGCVCCRIEGLGYVAPQIHHIVEGGRRLGHEFTLPLCVHHHVGDPPGVLSRDEARQVFGPSLALNKRAFVVRYGPERTLLARVDAQIVEGARPWVEAT